jgi:hypothetical protein
MKNIFLKLIIIIALGSLFSCDPIEDRNSLPSMKLTSSDLKYSAVVTGNNLVLKNLTPDVIPYWSYSDSKGNELGHSNLNETTIAMPFAGTFTVNFTAFERGGSVSSSVVVKVLQNDNSLFSDPRWALLTNGVLGKTWKLKMVAPIEFVGNNTHDPVMDAIYGAGAFEWNWYPNFSDISWAGFEDKDWGEITFDLNGGYNVTVKQTSVVTGSTIKTTKTGTYSYSQTPKFTNDRIIFNGNLEMLHMNGNYSNSFTFSNVRLYELTATTLSYAAIRDDGQILIYHLIPKPAN